MAEAFLHGVETIDVTQGPRPVRDVRSAVIGIVGTAPFGPVNELTLCLSQTDDAQFGADASGFTLPAALATLRKYGVGAVLVVNICPNGAPGEGGAPTAGDPVIENVLTKLIGGVDGAGVRTGLELMREGYGLFGFDARILIIPNFSSAPAIASALDTMATRLKAVAYKDLPLGLTPAEAISARGGNVAGVMIHQSTSDRPRLCYPHVQRFDPLTEGNVLEPLSIHAAGRRAKTDREVGFWTSSSNKPLEGVLGLERTLTARLDDPDSETNLLNAAGITTVFQSFGTGFRLWGNRNMSYPTSTAPENFEQVRRTRDMIEAAMHQNSLQWIDEDIDQAAIDDIVQTNDAYLRSLIQRGAIVGGTVWFDTNRTSPEEITNGQLRVQYKFTPKYPVERLTYEAEVTGEYLLNLRSSNTGDNQ